MTSITDPQVDKEARRERIFGRINKADRYLGILGLAWLTPVLKVCAGDDFGRNLKDIWRLLGVPVLAIVLFLLAWGALAPKVTTSLGAVPGPVQVWEQFKTLNADHDRQRDKAAAFYERQDARNAKLIAAGREDRVKERAFTGAPTFYDQIWTSLGTVFFGFLIATVIAIPLGIAGGLSPLVGAGMNPIIQIFKPVSPLAWLPIVTMVVSATVSSADPLFAKSFLVSAITVTLCSIWPTLINTTLGVASIDRDLINVSKVLKLGTWTKITKLVLPSALPLIFTGLRLSLGVGWMVLIAAEMLAQNPGLGKFVWDEFQNGSSQSLAKIMVAVLTIGLIGYMLDRLMYALQSMMTFSIDR
ncbi:nitrate transporter [Amylibacter marinus]|uniref:Nitrate transporter n=1 Tax=Amylibacter marinus TaxID=1475483 RepID=A0ABQ5VS60_9RHOB|nr:ABC transporter permease [Amylibacter marinus]GLQ33979.1 nitrate transporter [Amylibacter marinus]